MATKHFHCSCGLGFLAACLILHLNGAGAQTANSTTAGGVPGFAIALLAMMSIAVAALLCGLVFSLLCKRTRREDCKPGIAFYVPHFGLGNKE